MKTIYTHHQNQVYWQEEERTIVTHYSNQTIKLYPQYEHQTYDGMGGAFTEASAYNYHLLSAPQKERFMQAYFSKEGLHYNLGRTHFNSCDFALGNYSVLSSPDLATFDLTRDHQYLIPFMLDAIKVSDRTLSILGSPWSPCPFMKDNQEMNNGGTLLREYYELWAETLVMYVQKYRECGIPIDMISCQNEPEARQTWDSCLYTPEEEATFAILLKKACQRAGLEDVQLFIWDHNKDNMIERIEATIENPELLAHIDGIGFHWYGGDHFEAIETVERLCPNKKLYFTEGCVEYSRFAHDQVKNANMYAHDLIGNFKHGLQAFIDWNLLLDLQGGPNHVGNYCAAPILCNPNTQAIELQLSYYYLGHFSKFIQPQAKRITCSSYTHELECVAFKNPDGSLVSIVLNQSDKTHKCQIGTKEQRIEVTLEPQSIMTLIHP